MTGSAIVLLLVLLALVALIAYFVTILVDRLAGLGFLAVGWIIVLLWFLEHHSTAF